MGGHPRTTRSPEGTAWTPGCRAPRVYREATAGGHCHGVGCPSCWQRALTRAGAGEGRELLLIRLAGGILRSRLDGGIAGRLYARAGVTLRVQCACCVEALQAIAPLPPLACLQRLLAQ